MSFPRYRNLVVPHGFEVNYTLGFLKGLAQSGVSFLAVSCDDTDRQLQEAGVPSLNLRGSNDEGRGAFVKMRNLLAYYLKLSWLLARTRPHSLHFSGIFRNEFILFEGIVLNVLFRVFSKQYVYTAHNTLPHSKSESAFFKRMYRFIYKVPHVILVNTELAKRELVDSFAVPAEKIRTISIGLNEEVPITSLDRAQARSKLGLSEDAKAVLFFGKIDSYKGLDILLDATKAAEGSDLCVVVAGTYRDESYRKSIQDQLACLNLGAKLLLREEFIPNEDIEVYFKACDALCLPYRNIYQSGLVFLAPLFGIPIIAADVGSMSEYVSPANGLLFAKEDTDGLAQTINQFFEKEDCYDRLAIQKAGERFRWPAVCRAFSDLYWPSSARIPYQ